jgi:predicted GNAT superfamily acetyltransferase
VARNAHFNLVVLGARITEYLVDQYGAMNDGVNRGDESDRLMASWALAAPAPAPREGTSSRRSPCRTTSRSCAARPGGGSGVALPRAMPSAVCCRTASS